MSLIDIEFSNENPLKKSERLVISVPKLNKSFRALYNNGDKEGDQKLLYVIYVSDYRSPGNIKGLGQKDLHKDAILQLGLDADFEVSEDIERAIKEYKTVYNKGIYGSIIELRRNHENVRRSISLLTTVLDDELAKLEIEEVHTADDLSKKVKSLISSATQLKELTSTLDDDIDSLKKAESRLRIAESKRKAARGNSIITKSAE
jgi:hypothetical protein